MSKPERGSLTSLLAKKPLGQGAPAAVPMEEAESALLQGTVPPAVQPDVRTYSRPSEPIDAPKPATTGEPGNTGVLSGVHTSVRNAVPTDGQPTNLLNRSRRRTVRVPWTVRRRLRFNKLVGWPS